MIKICHPKGQVKENREIVFEKILSENFPKLVKDNKPPIQKAWKTSSRTNIRKIILKHIWVKLLKIKEKGINLKTEQKGEMHNFREVTIITDRWLLKRKYGSQKTME